MGRGGATKLVVDGYSFTRNQGNRTSTYWNCTKKRSKRCKTTVTTDKANRRIIRIYSTHNHAPDYGALIDF